MASVKKKLQGNVFVQKRNSVCEFTGWDRENERADFSVKLGSASIQDGMTKRELIEKLEDLLANVKAHTGDIFVVQ